MTARASYLRAWLVAPSTAGAAFLTDICGMLQAIASRSGYPVAFERISADDFRAALPAPLPAELEREIGIHRGQKAVEPLGRILTLYVGVELLGPGTPASTSRPPSDVLKTYNYQMEWAVRHATGEKSPLAAVLGGGP